MCKEDIKKEIIEIINSSAPVTFAKLIDGLSDGKRFLLSNDDDIPFGRLGPSDYPCVFISYNISAELVDIIEELWNEHQIGMQSCPVWHYLRDGWIPDGMDVFGPDITLQTNHFVWCPVELIPYSEEVEGEAGE